MTLRTTNKFCGRVKNISIDEVDFSRHCIRRELGDVKELRDSIDDLGLLQPVVVRFVEEGFEVVAGNRRFEACRQLGWQRIQCTIVQLDDREAFEVALVENIQRKTMSPVDEARAFSIYVDEFGWGGVTDLAKNIGRSPQYVSQRMQLLNLPNNLLRKLDEGAVTPSLLREVMVLDVEIRDSVVKEAIDKGLSSRRVGRLAKRLRRGDVVTEQFPDVLHAKSEDDVKLRIMNRLMCRCIDALRFSLLEFDEAVNKVSNDPVVRDLFMMQRRITHDQIDFLLKSKKRINTDLSCGI